MAKALVGCCGWSYGDMAEKGGWTGAFYPGTSTKKLPYYSKFFDTAEMDSTFYEKFYKYMTPATKPPCIIRATNYKNRKTDA